MHETNVDISAKHCWHFVVLLSLYNTNKWPWLLFIEGYVFW